MTLRNLLCALSFFFLSLAGMPSQASDTTAAPDVPPAVQQLLKHASQAWADRKFDEVMSDFHPGFKSIGRDREAQRKYLAEQVFPYLKRWEHSLKSFRQEGNIAHVMLVTSTEMGEMPFATQLILDGDRWYFYGNRQ